MAANGKFHLQLPQRDSYLELVKEIRRRRFARSRICRRPKASWISCWARGNWVRRQKLYLDALSDLTAAYEDEHHAIEPASDADMLRHLMASERRESGGSASGNGDSEIDDF